MNSADQAPLTITFIGPEGSGKTTMSEYLAKKLVGFALVVPEWPTFKKFLRRPELYAYDNQTEAMDYCLTAYTTAIEAGSNPIFADNCPDRIHLVHTWGLFRDGILKTNEHERLNFQYCGSARVWSPNYVYLRAELSTLLDRLEERNNPEDRESNKQKASIMLERWEFLVSDNDWLREKNVLILDGRLSLEELCDETTLWVEQRSTIQHKLG